MNNILETMLASGRVEDCDGGQIELHSNIGRPGGQLIQECIRLTGARHAVEVGLAFGVSTLFMLEALAKSDGRLFGIDPDQHNTMWRGLGLRNIERSGLAGYYEFFEKPSYQALPELLDRGERIQFAFIDGWHTFDYVLVDFFYIDKMLDIGGIVVFDDVGYKSIRKVCHFVLANLGYEVCSKLDGISTKSPLDSAKTSAKRVFEKLARTDWTPPSAVRSLHEVLDRTTFLAIRKTTEDARRWDHFVPF